MSGVGRILYAGGFVIDWTVGTAAKAERTRRHAPHSGERTILQCQ